MCDCILRCVVKSEVRYKGWLLKFPSITQQDDLTKKDFI